ncbi:hypothetical protein [Streptomyces sp. NPDC006879]|uniref:hypothetical protein n=1 Tax=Streptomyces sp. NPDC006879 TaxID=3364767 RepID=UPI0036A61732
MKQSAAKSLGAAALGVAFAAAAAGTASAAALPELGAGGPLGTVTGLAQAIPAADTVGQLTNHTEQGMQSDSSDPLAPATGLLGGLTAGGGLPTGGLPLGG